MPCRPLRKVREISVILLLVGVGLRVRAEQATNMSFNLPDGLTRTQTVVRKINTWTKATLNSPEVDVDTSVFLVSIKHTSTETRIEQVETAHSRTVNGVPLLHPSQQVMIGKTNTFVVSPDGDLLRVEHDDNYLDDIKAAFPPAAHASLETALGGLNGFFMAKRSWQMSVKRYVGMPVKVGTRWRQTVTMSFETNSVPFKVYTVTVVLKQAEEGAKRLVTTLSLEATNPEDMQFVYTNGMSVELVRKFFMQNPARPLTSRRVARWRTVEIDTMLPIREEREERWFESRPKGLAELDEFRVETYDDGRR